MNKKFTLATVLLFAGFFQGRIFAQQTIQLYYEDFNAFTPTWTVNSPANVSSNTGSNEWIINNIYNGNGLYPNTPDENQTAGGTIAGAPYSNYMHVYDANNAATTTNCNYDPNQASDRMTVMNTSFCTLGLTDVTLTFFFICEGTANDYAQLYYSIDGGSTWIQTGMSQYNNQPIWKYEIVTDPAFDNQTDLRFAFRWKNGTGAAASVAFGVDDIICVGTYDNVNNPVTLTITSVSPNPVCKGGYIFIYWELSAPLCDGVYEVELSSATGNWSSPISLGVFNIYAGQTTGGIAAIAPTFIVSGTCYEVRINRVSPAPTLTGTASVCFEIKDCPNTITTLQPPVTYGPDTVCNYSVIDVPFYSTGVFNFNNVYTAELSDVNGSFAAPTTLGSSPDPNTYDPSLGSPPGSVSGLIPNVPEGCGYLVRVVSSNPNTIGSPWGPFCIHHCDVTTNNMQDISVCISDYVGADTTLNIDIGTWPPPSTYNPGNEFKIQVLSSSTFQVLNTGTLGTIAATGSTTITLSIPGLISLIPILPPKGWGTYYMRIVATDANPAYDSLGTLVHLVIGYIDSALVLYPSDTVVCAGAISSVMPLPYDPDFQYQWYCPPFFNTPTFWPYWPLYLNWSGVPAGTYPFTCRTLVNGCYGPWSDTVWITVEVKPSSIISGPNSVCEGDTVTYTSSFIAGTYYDWSSAGINIIDTSNNQVTVFFDSVGTVKLFVFALNMCGSNNGTKTITVHPKPEVIAPPDTTICAGTSITLNATGNVTSFSWYKDDSLLLASNPVTDIVDSTTLYAVEALSTYGCKKSDTTIVTVYPIPHVDASSTDITCYGENDGTATGIASGGVPPFAYSWSTVPPSGLQTVDSLSAGAYSVTITDADGCTSVDTVLISDPPQMNSNATATPESSWNSKDGTASVVVTGGTPPFTYEWNTNPPQTTPDIFGLGSGTYIVTITDANGCKTIDTVEISSAPDIFAIPNVFTPNGDGLNDIFTVNEANINTIEMKIYNRWGQLLFFTKDINQGWDGTFEGKQEEIGTYVYDVKAEFLNGLKLEKKGNVILLR